MKTPILSFTILSLIAGGANAASSIQYEISVMRNAAGVAVPQNGGSWVMIVDQDNNQSLPGGITYAENNLQSATISNASALAAAFSGKSLSVGTNIGGNVIHAIKPIGDFDLGAGSVTGVTVFDDAQDNKRYGIYWFVGFLPGDLLPTSGTFQVGAVVDGRIDSLNDPSLKPRGMTAPPDNFAGEFALFDFNVNAITVNAIPEPSSLMFGGLALAGLFLRRRTR